MNSYFRQFFNPFRGCSHEELVIAYVQYSGYADREAVAMVADAYDEDTFIDLRMFGIATRDFQ